MKLDINSVTIGADPEVFVKNTEGIQIVVGKLGGTKAKPLALSDTVHCQEDNVLAEFNIAPAHSAIEFDYSITDALALLSARLKAAELDIEIKSSHHFDIAVLAAGGRQARMFGCDPDFNAWSGMRNVVPNPRTTLRTAGGHIHIGYSTPDHDTNKELIKWCDVLLGLPSVLNDPDTERRSLYGGAGAYRDKPYGCEYRSLSNFWLASRGTRIWAFEQARRATELVAAGQIVPSVFASDIQRAINTSCKDTARGLMQEFAHV